MDTQGLHRSEMVEHGSVRNSLRRHHPWHLGEAFLFLTDVSLTWCRAARCAMVWGTSDTRTAPGDSQLPDPCAQSLNFCKEMSGLKNQRRNQETCGGPNSKVVLVGRSDPPKPPKIHRNLGYINFIGLSHRSNDQNIQKPRPAALQKGLGAAESQVVMADGRHWGSVSCVAGNSWNKRSQLSFDEQLFLGTLFWGNSSRLCVQLGADPSDTMQAELGVGWFHGGHCLKIENTSSSRGLSQFLWKLQWIGVSPVSGQTYIKLFVIILVVIYKYICIYV